MLDTYRRIEPLAIVGSCWLLVLFVRYLFPPLFPVLKSSFGITNATIGLLFSALMGAYAIIQFPAGLGADRLGARVVILLGLGVAMVGTIAVVLAPTPLVLAMAMVAIGAGTGVFKTTAIPLVGSIYPRRTGLALGSMDAMGQVGGIAAPAVALGVAHWQDGFLLIAGLFGGLSIVFFGRLRVPAATMASGHKPSVSFRAYLRPFRTSPALFGFGLVATMVSFVWNGASAFLPLFITTYTGQPAWVGGVAFSLLFVVGLGQPLFGQLGDVFGYRITSALAVVLALLGTVGLVLIPSRLGIFGATTALGLGLHSFRPLRDAHLIDLLPADRVGGSLGAFRSVMMGVGSLAPAVVGATFDVAGPAVAFSGLGVCLLVALMVYRLVPFFERSNEFTA